MSELHLVRHPRRHRGVPVTVSDLYHVEVDESGQVVEAHLAARRMYVAGHVPVFDDDVKELAARVERAKRRPDWVRRPSQA